MYFRPCGFPDWSGTALHPHRAKLKTWLYASYPRNWRYAGLSTRPAPRRHRFSRSASSGFAALLHLKTPCPLYPPKADMRSALAHVYFGPLADIYVTRPRVYLIMSAISFCGLTSTI